MWRQGRVTALAASKYCWEEPDRNGETLSGWWERNIYPMPAIWVLFPPDALQHSSPGASIGMCSLQQNLLPLWTLSSVSHRRSSKESPRPTARSSLPDPNRRKIPPRPLGVIPRWQSFQGNISRGSWGNEQPRSTRAWSQLVTPRTARTFPWSHLSMWPRGRDHYRS